MLFLQRRSGKQESAASHKWPRQPNVQSLCSMIYGLSGMEVTFDKPAGFSLHSLVAGEPVSMDRR